MMMQANNLHNLYIIIQTLEIRIIKSKIDGKEAMSFAHYSSNLDWLEPDVKKIKELALSEILLLPREQILYSLNRLLMLRSDITTVITNCESMFYNGEEDKLLKWLARSIPNFF